MRRLLVPLVLLALLPVTVGLAPSGEDPWDAKTLDRAALEKALADTQAAAKAIPDTEKPDTPAGRKKALLETRAKLITELLAVLDRRAAAAEAEKKLPDVDVLKKEVTALEAAALPGPPEAPTSKDGARLRAQAKAAQEQHQELAGELERLQKRVTGFADRLVAERRRASEAKIAAETQAKELAGIAPAAPERADKVEALRTVRLLARTAAVSIRALEVEEAADRATAPVFSLQVELARMRAERLAKQVARYQDALRIRYETEIDKFERQVREAKNGRDAATRPSDVFLAELELKLAEKRLILAKLNARKVRLSTLRTAQDRHRKLDESQFQRRLDLVGQSRNARAASDLLKKVNARIAERKQDIAGIRQGDHLKELDNFLELQLEVDDELQELTLDQEWEERVDKAVEGLDDWQVFTIKERAVQLRVEYRKLLQEKLEPVFEQLRTERDALEVVLDEHGKLLDRYETKIRARFLWYRDAPVLGAEVLKQAADELRHLPDRAESLHDTQAMSREVSRRSVVEMVALAAVFLLLLPAGLVLLRIRLFRLHARLLGAGGREAPRVRILLIGLVRATLFPAYAYGLSALVVFAPLHAAPSLITQVALRIAGHSFLILGVTRVLFGRHGIAISLYGMMEDTARTIRSTVVVLLLASVAFLLPWAVLRQEPPFGFLALPRIAYTFFEVCALVAIVMLLRRKSPFMRDLASRTMSQNVKRLWRLIALAAMTLGVGSVVLDVLGHRFIAFEIAVRLVISLGLVFLLVGAFITIVPRIDEVLRRRVGKLTAAPGETMGTSAWEFGRQLRQFLSGFFVLVLVFVFANLWGLDVRALDALDQIPLYTVATTTEGKAVVASAGDLATCLIIIGLTFWLLRYLPGIFELLIYPRVRWDSGVRYAVLSISRYTIAFVGIVVALGAIHLNLGRLGWLMAAVGVGLGFGLQEIVSNFVSGIILLVERPIRVGDIVTIGTVSGVVTKINIRATTVRNWDRLEVVLPNKDLITKEVTNWTLGDSTTRVTVKIGVAYGTDIELVRRILHEIVTEQPEVLKDPEPTIIFMAHGASSLDFEVRVFLARTAQRMPLLDRINVLINQRLGEHGIEIPFSQHDIHIRTPGDAAEPKPVLDAPPPAPEEPAPGAPTVQSMGEGGAEDGPS